MPMFGMREGDCGMSITVAFIDLISNFQRVMYEKYVHIQCTDTHLYDAESGDKTMSHSVAHYAKLVYAMPICM